MACKVVYLLIICMSDHILVLTAFPDIDTAQRLAKQIVRANLAACVSILPQAQSIYTWQGKECTAIEHIALIKTTESSYSKLESYIQSRHPYELPEIIATPITMGLENYLTWITQGAHG